MKLRLPNPLSAVVWLAFFAPASVLGGWADRALGLLVLVVGLAVLASQPSPWEARRPSAQAFKFFALLEILFALSALYSAGFNGSAPAPWDLYALARGVVLGTFVVWLIRHFDASVRRAVDMAATAAAYLFLLIPAADPQGGVALLTLCWLLFFSRLRLRFLHATAALLVVILSDAGGIWAAAWAVPACGAALLAYRALSRRRARRAGALSVALGAALLVAPAIYRRAAGTASAAASEAVVRPLLRRSPLFGWGPLDAAATPGRSQYVLWTLKGGLLGAGLIVAGLLLVGGRLLLSASADAARFAGMEAFLASVALMLTAGRFFESDRFFFLTAFFAAAMSGADR
jgi:hypothetical protein